ncbi:hypothetical protein GCM10009087_27470 [Sphingomonas oligophenolica]|uniref:DUF6445 family protein n=1 Tax=Sphingomonas oligophenolica TaxID=301154 RepID=A0ABU9Y4F1_9SPHN
MASASAISYDLSVNPRPRVVLGHVGNEREPVLIVDDLLNHPAALIDYATWEVAFTPAGNPDGGYPGVRAAAPLNYVEAVVRALSPIVEQAFKLRNVALSNAECSLSITTTPPEQLTVQQRTPHIDTVYPLQFALLHYLCAPDFGGTSFYRHRATGYETLDEARAAAYDAARARELVEDVPPQRYVGGDSLHYVRIGGCDARFNRMAIYRSCLLHSGHISEDKPLVPSPCEGRLTANIFVNYRQC